MLDPSEVALVVRMAEEITQLRAALAPLGLIPEAPLADLVQAIQDVADERRELRKERGVQVERRFVAEADLAKALKRVAELEHQLHSEIRQCNRLVGESTSEAETMVAERNDYAAETLALRARVAELEALPVVPIGWEVGQFVWSHSRHEWTRKQSPKRSWTFLKLRDDGSICYRRHRVPAAVYDALAYAVRTGERPLHAADIVSDTSSPLVDDKEESPT